MRHNLSLNKCFEKVENKMSGSSRKGCLWALNLARIDKMEEEMYKWKRKDLAAIHRSMANPGEAETPPPPPAPHVPTCVRSSHGSRPRWWGHRRLVNFPPSLPGNMPPLGQVR